MKIAWSDIAEADLDDLYDYIVLRRAVRIPTH